jgi:hypothetical protein
MLCFFFCSLRRLGARLVCKTPPRMYAQPWVRRLELSFIGRGDLAPTDENKNKKKTLTHQRGSLFE